MSTRGAGGWASQDIALPHATVVGSQGSASEYRFFSEDLSLSVVEPLGPFTSLAPEVFPPDTERTSYLRHNSTCTATPATSATCFEPLVTERLQLISLLPDETPATENARLGSEAEIGHGGVARHAISDDGSRIVWSAGPNSFRHLYVRDTLHGQTVQLDVPESEAGAGQSDAQFQAASRDGSRVFFTDTQRLTRDSRTLPKQPDLYSCDVIQGGSGRCCSPRSPRRSAC